MSLNRQELAYAVAELQAVLPNTLLRKINAPGPNQAQLVFRHHILLLDFNRGLTRLHLIQDKIRAPATPPAWVMKARAEIQGRILTDLSQLPQDRVVRLEFKAPPRRSLVAELFGSGRLLLLDKNNRIVARLLGSGQLGQVYQVPQTGSAPDPRSRFVPGEPEELLVNRAICEHYTHFSAERELSRLRQQSGKRLAAKEKKIARRLGRMEKDLRATMKAESLSRGAEALKVQLGSVRRGQQRVTLPDPWNLEGEHLVIELDPALDALSNMKRMFSRARRLTAARGQITGRIEQARSQLADIRQLAARVAMADSPAAIAALQKDLEHWAGKDQSSRAPSKNKKGRRTPYKLYRSKTGQSIMVGRSGPDNHSLTFRVARGQDMWLHTRDSASAHVIVRLGRGEQADEQTLIDAATLAAHHSTMKDASKVEITYTRVKNVHPIKGAPPGLVSVAKGKTLLVRMEAERIQRLKKTLEKQ